MTVQPDSLYSLPRSRSGGFRFSRVVDDVLSIEACFVMFLFAGRYKDLPGFSGVPVDLTLLFYAATVGLLTWAVISGRMRAPTLDGPALLMLAFGAFALISVYWSSLEYRNIDKLWRFALLTVPSFYMAHMMARTLERRHRLARMLVLFSCALLLYYAYGRWVLGIEAVGIVDEVGNTGEGLNYLEYASHANILFTACLAVSVFGSRRGSLVALAGAGGALVALFAIGGRGPLAQAGLALPLLGAWLFFRDRRGFGRLALFMAGLGAMAVVGYLYVIEPRGIDAAAQEFHTLQRFQLHLSGESTSSLDVRSQAQELALQKWLERPIEGWGFGEFRLMHSLDYPHNVLFEILAEMGLIGAFLFFSVVAIAILVCLWMRPGRSCGWAEVMIALLFLTDVVAHVTTQGYLADDRVFFAYMGVLIGLREGLRRERTARHHPGRHPMRARA